jgi:hypothetical protein
MRGLPALAVLAGCASIHPDPEAGRSFAIQHELYHYGKAMGGAQEHCAKMGLHAQHTGTHQIGLFTPHGGALSWFECVEAEAPPPSV